jgi:hypothetical protein
MANWSYDLVEPARRLRAVAPARDAVRDLVNALTPAA